VEEEEEERKKERRVPVFEFIIQKQGIPFSEGER